MRDLRSDALAVLRDIRPDRPLVKVTENRKAYNNRGRWAAWSVLVKRPGWRAGRPIVTLIAPLGE